MTSAQELAETAEGRLAYPLLLIFIPSFQIVITIFENNINLQKVKHTQYFMTTGSNGIHIQIRPTLCSQEYLLADSRVAIAIFSARLAQRDFVAIRE